MFQTQKHTVMVEFHSKFIKSKEKFDKYSLLCVNIVPLDKESFLHPMTGRCNITVKIQIKIRAKDSKQVE